ncbi:MAG: hypothetical protein FGM50_07655 [Mycobacterium sp.]|nr:hypothetical protein [Mycobacterium sp.]
MAAGRRGTAWWAARWAVPVYALGLTVAVTGPLLAPGYLLLRDAVSTPRSYLSDSALGLGGTAPRAVPQDFAVASLSAAVDGGAIVTALLFAALLLAGWGAARLAAAVVGEAGLAGQFIAATLAVWNPYVAERLLQGHWSLLLGYGCLPWVAVAVVRLRAGTATAARWAALVAPMALAGLTPTGLILAAVVGLTCVAVPGPGVRRPRCAAAITVISALAAAPWLLASALGGTLGQPQSAGLSPFAARAEPGLGTLGSLAGLGGLWNADAVPSSRTTHFAIVGTLVLLAVVLAGVPSLRRIPVGLPLLALAAVSVLLPAAMATGPGLAALRLVVDVAPGLAVLRDGQKWVALAMPGYALAGAASVLTVRRRIPSPAWAAVCCLAVIAVLPDLTWGVGAKLRPVQYPPGWTEVAARINSDPRPVAVLPVDTMRQFGWAGPAPVLDPMPRWVRADVLFTGDLMIAGATVTGEGTRAREIQRLLLTGADPAVLQRAGVGWVVVESKTPGDTGSAATTLSRLTPAYRDGDLSLYRVGGTSAGVRPAVRVTVLAAHLVWAALLLGAAAVLMVQSIRRPWRRS